MSYSDYELVVGLEIHAQLTTKSKLFSPVSTEFEAGDNENISEVCVGLPGTLPVLNKAVVDQAVRAGIALSCQINTLSQFSRKQYFYPDLSKGYQISQFDKPVCGEGLVSFFVGSELKKVRIERAHIEEDAGKSTHHGTHTYINYNRAGMPLLEIVSAPDIRSAKEAAEYARTVRNILRYQGVCDGNLEEGSLRCDCNISIRKKGDPKLGTKVELKNINSFRFIEKAIDYEYQRQIDCKESQQTIYQETRLYDSTKNVTVSMRSKEEADDYRYFPDPDLLDLQIEESFIEERKKLTFEGPVQRQQRYMQEYSLNQEEAYLLTQERDHADYFESVVDVCKNPKLSCNWISGEIFRMLNEEKVEIAECPIKPQSLGGLINQISKGVISGKIAKDVFTKMWESGDEAEVIIEKQGLKQVSDSGAIEAWVDEVLSKNPENVSEYKSGKTKIFGFFVGQVMKLSKGQASPDLVNKLLKEKLNGE